jgi:hypothetical protein
MTLSYHSARELDQMMGDLRVYMDGMESAQRESDKQAVRIIETIELLLEGEDDTEGHSALYGYLRNALRDAERATSVTGKAMSKVVTLMDSVQKARSEYFFLRGFEEEEP